MSLSGVYAVVTGGASGLGRATAKFLAGNGAKVLVADLQAPAQPLEGLFVILFVILLFICCLFV